MTWFLTLLLLLAPPPITLTILPRVCLAPCTLRIQVRVTPDEDNRWLVIQVDGPMASRSEIQLDGDHAPITQPFKYVYGLPVGAYEVSAEVWGTHGVRGRQVVSLEVN